MRTREFPRERWSTGSHEAVGELELWCIFITPALHDSTPSFPSLARKVLFGKS
jgi:hypothetical protein